MAMAKHNKQPLTFPTTMRPDNVMALTSCRAGEMAPIAHAWLFRNDSATGRIRVDAELAEMPKPCENAIIGRLMSWFIPKSALPQFASKNEFVNSWHGEDVTQLGASARTPRALFDTVSTGAIATVESSEIFRSLGLALTPSTEISTDLIDSYVHIYNFRLSQHTSKGTRADYYSEDGTTSLEIKPAFWPRNRMHDIVADYEQALVVGQLDLEAISGTITMAGLATVLGIGKMNDGAGAANNTGLWSGEAGTASKTSWVDNDTSVGLGETGGFILERHPTDTSNPYLRADLATAGDVSIAGSTIGASLANIDKARLRQAYAKAIANMDGNNFSGYNSADIAILEMISGYSVEEDMYSRPWLLASETGVFGMGERHATDSANLDDSVTVGRLSLQASIQIPMQDTGGCIITTFEFMPERIYPRAKDPILEITTKDGYPDALRDSLNIEPVETRTNSEIDVKHATPAGTYGFAPLNSRHRREFTRMGGNFRSLTPGSHATAARTQVWQPEYVDPSLTIDHWQCPHPFPQDVFSVPADDTCILSVQQNIVIRGQTQFGEQLVEDNNELANITTEAAT